MQQDFVRRVEEIISKDPRYKPDAYEFVMQALLFTQKKLKRQGHVSGLELLLGIKDLALEQYGPLSKVVLGHWGVAKTDDFGRIVFNMIEKGLLGRRDEDSVDDFKDVYDFKEAFDAFRVMKPKRPGKEKPYEKVV